METLMSARECGVGPAEKATLKQLQLIVAHEEDGFIQRVSQQFEGLGWEVYPAHSAQEVRRLAAEVPSAVIILPTQLREESGWLICAKLVQTHPDHKVLLVGPYSTQELQRYTRFVGGSALLRLDCSLRSLVEVACEAAEPACAS